MKKFTKDEGLDVHKETITVAIVDATGSELRFHGEGEL